MIRDINTRQEDLPGDGGVGRPGLCILYLMMEGHTLTKCYSGHKDNGCLTAGSWDKLQTLGSNLHCLFVLETGLIVRVVHQLMACE